MSNKVVRCEYCNMPITNNSYVVIGQGAVSCFRCWRQTVSASNIKVCAKCGKRVIVAGGFNGEVYCEECCQSIIHCNSCGKVINDSGQYIDYGSDKICYKCIANGRLIHDYSYNPPNPVFYGANSKIGTLFMGIELEVSTQKDFMFTKDIDKRYWYLKFDSSVARGCELVSYPMTYEYLKRNKNILGDLMFLPIVSDMRHNCGLHIHLSKAAFGNYHLWKFMRFIYSPHNRDFIYAVSGRNESSMDRWAKIKGSTYIKERARTLGQYDLDRHHAVNLQRRDTVELRIFTGTLNPNELWGRIEFTHALYEYTRIANNSDLTHDKFKTYLESNQKMYPCTYKYIKGICTCV